MWQFHIYDMRTSELKKGSAEFLVLSLLEAESRHGYELSKLIEAAIGRRAHLPRRVALSPALPHGGARVDRGTLGGARRTAAATLLRITREGLKTLEAQRKSWKEFVAAIGNVVKVRHA